MLAIGEPAYEKVPAVAPAPVTGVSRVAGEALLVIANWPLGLGIFLVIMAVVLVPTYWFKHTKPSHRDAREHFRVKEPV